MNKGPIVVLFSWEKGLPKACIPSHTPPETPKEKKKGKDTKPRTCTHLLILFSKFRLGSILIWFFLVM